MNQPSNQPPVSYRTQLDKIAITGFRGSQIIMVYAIGQELGIFEYLFKKSKSQPLPKNNASISFSFNELGDQLSLQPNYLDAWLQMAVECGLFEIDQTSPRTLKTAPFIYELLVNNEDYIGLYVGAVMEAFSYLVSNQPFMLQAFRTGEELHKVEIPIELRKMQQKNSARLGARVEQVFSMKCQKYQEILRHGGKLLEVGCGFGYNLETWADKYQKAQIVGLDIDADALKSFQERTVVNNWGDRIILLHASTGEYAQSPNVAKTFDMVLISHVLHEMDPNDAYRKSVIMDIYSLLKDDGLLIVADPMIPKLFAPPETRSGQEWFNFLRAFSKWNEVAYGARFYDKESFQELIARTPFSHVELLQDAENTIWAIKK